MGSYHIHTLFSDGRSSFEDYLREAEKLSLNEIGFSDHFCLLPNSSYHPVSIMESELPLYVEAVLKLKKDSDIKIFGSSE